MREELERYARELEYPEAGDTQQQELYTAAFDLNPVASLEVGWHLFGEQYERGAFLVRMRQELRRFELPESTELPDHLTHVLRVLARMPEEEAAQFGESCVLPAVEKMAAALAEKNNPYEPVLRAVEALVRQACVEVQHA